MGFYSLFGDARRTRRTGQRQRRRLDSGVRNRHNQGKSAKYSLIFERFLNEERVSNPDFDIDFCVEGREKVIEYVISKYGEKTFRRL